MSLAIFSPNKTVSGGALIAKSAADGSLFISFFRQIANNPDKKNNFDFKNGVNVKFSEDEIGDMIHAVRTKKEAKFFHSFDGVNTSGSYRYYKIEGENGKGGREGFGFSVSKGELTIKVGFTVGSAERFCEFLKFTLNKSFEKSYIEDLAKEQEFRNKNKSKAKENEASDSNEAEKSTKESNENESEEGDLDF